MLKEQNTTEAINALVGGEKVMVMTSFDETDGSCLLIPLKSFLDRYKLLVDVKMEKEPEILPDPAPAGQESKTTRPSGKAGGSTAPGTKRKKVDTGKLLALHQAGWTGKKIAEELRVSEATVSSYLKKMEEGQDEED